MVPLAVPGRPDAAREVEPAAVVDSGWRWYLVSYDLGRDDCGRVRLRAAA